MVLFFARLPPPAGPVVAAGLALLLAGCASAPSGPVTQAPVQPARVAAAYPVTALVGSWGVASFREDRDRPRTETMARQHCRLPYVITKGPTDGVMMHVADDAKLYELTLKGSADGKIYLGFDAPPGHPQDRQILSLTENLIVMRFVAPDVHARYGTFVYVRCPGGGATAAR
ncbi:hypothetical protein C6569_01920 [Phreatobacter cathodiphilus]|uniref:Lipoprotein n=1 Tax=Phreatobacter cathodiphilus TaxID=1868589 RepID=A0A2S0N6Y4_9HYPH|nr:hypothetical protein C6569_01920 [Phreatobacter cathodiphilus]